jgi:hypothetical protein
VGTKREAMKVQQRRVAVRREDGRSEADEEKKDEE